MNKLFKVVRWIAVVAVLAVAAGLALKIEWRSVSTLDLFWKGIVPLVPLLLLLTPHVWRGICPVAVFNLLGDRLARLRQRTRPAHLSRETNRWIKLYGAVLAAALLWILVPLRLLLFNDSAWASLALVLAIAVVALAMGFAVPWKGGWCSSLCPVYPVEKFYGSAAVWMVKDSRCFPGNLPESCYRCALHCLDVPPDEERYWQAMNGAPAERLTSWTRDVFLGSFPGFVLAYLVLSNFGNLPRFAPSVRAVVAYGTFVLLMAASYLFYRVAQWALVGARTAEGRTLWARRVDLLMVLLAVNLYYLIGGVGMAEVASKLAGWEQQRFAISVSIVSAVLLVSLLWLHRAWRANKPAWVRW